MAKEFDLIVIGGGPGGYVAAIRSSQLGMSTALVEKDRLGGVCLNWGCIPTKALLKNAEIVNLAKRGDEYGIKFDNLSIDFPKVIARSRKAADRMSKGVEYLVRHNNIKHFSGTGHLIDSSTVNITYEGKTLDTIAGKHIILATGGRPHPFPGLDFDGKTVISSKEAMIPEEIPESIIIIGGGAVGAEFAYFYASFGSHVTIIEMLPQLLPNEDSEISGMLSRAFKKQNITVITGSKVHQANHAKWEKNGVEVKVQKGSEIDSFFAEKLLVAIGIKPNTENLGLEELGIEMERGFIVVDESYQTSVKGVYAVGDCIGGQLLAHAASAEGIACVESIAGHNNEPVDYDSIPHCTYCQPQVASIGLTEKQAKEAGYELKIGKYPFRANGKSVAVGETEGMVKLIFDAADGKLLGAHIIGSDATEMIAELGIAKNMKSTYLEILKTVHAHPTLSESIMEAAGQAYGVAIHI